MSIADIVIIAIVALFALIGLAKGFFKTLISFFGWFISILIAALTARVVAEALLDITAVGNFVAGGGEGFSLFKLFKGILPPALSELPATATADEITAALGTGVVGSILKPFIGLLTSTTNAANSVSDGIALSLAGGVFEIVVGIGMFIVCRILMTLFTMFAKSLINPDKKKGFLGRIGGFVFGAVRGALYCAILLVVIGFLTPFQFMQPVTSEIDKGVIAKPIAQQVYTLSGRITSHQNYYDKLLEIYRRTTHETTEDEVAVSGFFDEALVDNGGIYEKQLFGDSDRYDVIINGLKGKFEAASNDIKGGKLADKADKIAELAQAVKAAGEETPSGAIYAAFEKFTGDLDRYHKAEEAADKNAIENELDAQLETIQRLLNDETPFKELFGEIRFTEESQPEPDPVPTPEPTPTPEPESEEA